MKTILVILAMMLLVSCNPFGYDTSWKTLKDSDFDQIYWHEHDVFSFWIVDKSQTPNKIDIFTYNGPYIILIDTALKVPGHILVQERHTKYSSDSYVRQMIITLKNADVAQGGGWNHGKFGQGTTIKLN